MTIFSPVSLLVLSYYELYEIIHQVKKKKTITRVDLYDTLFHRLSVVIICIEKIRQTLFHRLSKHLEFRQECSAARRIFDLLLGVWISP